MSRPEVGKILEHIAGVDAPRVILVHGKPGAGKSGVLLGVADGIVERGIPLLPLSLSTRPPEGSVHQYGEALGLHATPSAALRASAGQGRTVLLVNQLDALRLTTSGAAATWRTCARCSVQLCMTRTWSWWSRAGRSTLRTMQTSASGRSPSKRPLPAVSD